MMRWLKDKKKERRSNSASYDDEGKEDDYGFEKERTRAASKSPSTRRQLPPTPAMPEEKSPHIYEEISDMACTASPPAPQASAESHRKKIAPFGKKTSSGGKAGKDGVSKIGIGGGGAKGAGGNKYTSDLSSSILSTGGGSTAKKSKFDDSDGNGQYIGDDTSRQTPPNLHRNGTPEVHCDVIIKDTHCEILLSRKPKSGGGGAGSGRTDVSSGYPSGNPRTSSTGGESYPSSWSQQSDVYVGPQAGRFNGQNSSRDRRASVDVHSSSKFTSAFSLASSSSSIAPVMGGVGGASASSGGAQNSSCASFSSSTSRLNSLGVSTSFSVLNFAEPHQPKSAGSGFSELKQWKQQQAQQDGHVYEHMQAMPVASGADETNGGAGESAGSVTSSAKGVETYTTASNFIARPTIVPFKPLPGAKDPCVEAFGRPLSTGSSSVDGAYASIHDEALGDSAYQTAPLKNLPSQTGANASVTYASIQDADDKADVLGGSSTQVAYASIESDKHLQLPSNQNNTDVKEPHHRLFYGANPNSFQQSSSLKPNGFFQGPIRSGVLHRRSPSDSSSCTYASVSFPVEPKHYNTISDIGNGMLFMENRRRSYGSTHFVVKYDAPQHQGLPADTAGCTSDASDGIYSGVEPYRVKPDCFNQCPIGKGGASSKDVKLAPHSQGFGAKSKSRASFGHQNFYADMSPEHDPGNRSDLYASIDPSDSNIDGGVGNSKTFIYNRNIACLSNTNSNNNFLSPSNDLHRFAVDRSSFHIDFCTCSDDHASSCGFGDLTSAKTVEDKKCNDESAVGGGGGGAFSGVSPKGDNARSDSLAPSSCKDCGRLIKQITYSESYSDETYEHAYSSRLLTRKSRRYSSPDITFSEISNSEFNPEPPSYLQYRASPSWSRRSPAAHDARISRDDTWASSPRSDDVIPPAYGALDDNGFVSGGYERWSPTYARNRDKDITCSQTESLTSGHKKIRPWMSAAPTFPEGLLDENMADDAKARLYSGGEVGAGSAFFTPNSGEHLDVYPLDKENTEPKSSYLLRNDLETLLPEDRSTIRQSLNFETTIDTVNKSGNGRHVKKDKSQTALVSKSAENNVKQNNLTKSNITDEDVEQRDQIPDRNTKKLASYFQSLSKEVLVGSEDNILIVQVDDPSNGSNTSKSLASHHKSSAFTKLPLHSSSFCAPKMADSKKKSHIYNETNNPGSQSSPDVSKARHRREIVTTSLVLNSKIDATEATQQKCISSTNKIKNESNARTSDVDITQNMVDNATSGTQKPQNKTDSGDTCYEFDISTSSEGEQQSSYDNLLTKVGMSFNLEQEVQHIADSRVAARRKRLLCRQCKKRGATSTNVYSIIDDTACETDTPGATGNRDWSQSSCLNTMDGADFGFMMEDDGMCPHLSLKFGELRAMLDNMFVDQRAAILDCMTDQSATPNPYSFKTGGQGGLHLCGQDLASLPAALQQLCRECGCEVMTSDSESVTTVYSGSLQVSQPGVSLRMTSPGSGAPQTPSCDSDEGTMADNSGDDDDDMSADEENRTKKSPLKKNSPPSCSYVESKQSGRKNSSPFDLTKSHKYNHHRFSAGGSSNNGSTHSINLKSNNDNDDEANNSSGYDEPNDHQRPQHSASRHERSTHRTRKKEKRDRKSACMSNHTLSCACYSDSKSSRRTSLQNGASACTLKSSYHSTGCGDSSSTGFPSQKVSKDAQSWVNGVQIRKAGGKKHNSTTQCGCTSPYCPKHGAHRHSHSHPDQHQERGRASRGNTGDQQVCNEEENETTIYHQQGSNSSTSGSANSASSVSDKALKDIYSPLPAKALCLLTSRHNNKTNSNNNSHNNSEGIININNSSVISSNSSSSGSNTSSCSLVVNNVPCTCQKNLALDDGELENPNAVYSSSFSSVTPSLLPAAHKVKQTSAEVEPETKDQASPGCPTSRENDIDKGDGARENGSNEMASKEPGNNDKNDNNNGCVGERRDDEATGRPSDNGVIKAGGRVTAVQTHLAREKFENSAQSCVNTAPPVNGGGRAVGGNGSGCLPCCDSTTQSGFERVGEKRSELCPHGETVPATTCCCGGSRGCSSRVERPQQHYHYRHHHSVGQNSLCTASDNSPQPRASQHDSNNLGSMETSDAVPAPCLGVPNKHKPPLGFSISQDKSVKNWSVDHTRKSKTVKREDCFGAGGMEREINMPRGGSKGFEDGNALIKPTDDNIDLDETCTEERRVSKRREKSSDTQAETGKERSVERRCDNKTAEITPAVTSADARQREIIHNLPFPKPAPRTGTTGEPTQHSSLQGVACVSRSGQCENHCSTEQHTSGQQGRDNGIAPAKDMQMKSSEIPSLSSSVSSSHQDDSNSVASPTSTPFSTSSPVIVSNCPSVKAKLVIPRKHKLELATLDLLPETALGSDMGDSENDSIFEKDTTTESTATVVTALPMKPKPRERTTKTNLVQKMAKMFEEQASNKPSNDNNEDKHRRGSLGASASNSSPRVQRSSGVKAIPPARAPAATSVRKPDVKFDDGAIIDSDAAPLLPAVPLSLRVSSVQSSPDVPHERPNLSKAILVPESKPDCPTPGSHKCGAASTDQHYEEAPKEMRLRVGVSERKAVETGEETELVGEQRKPTMRDDGCDRNRVSKPRGSKMKHSDLLQRLKNAKDSKTGGEQYQVYPGDSSSASSSPSSTKKATVCSLGVDESGNQVLSPSANATGSGGVLNQHAGGKQKRYSKKPYHKRRSKSRNARRRSGSRAGLDREERTYYYFSSDLSDIDVMEVDDWETYASAMTVKKQSQSHAQRSDRRSRGGKVGVEEEGARLYSTRKDTPTGELSTPSSSPLKTRKKAESSHAGDTKPKSRVSRELKDARNSGAAVQSHKAKCYSREEVQSTGEDEDEDMARGDMEIYSCISPTPTTTANGAAAASMSASSSPMASPELPKPRRSKRSACADGTGTGTGKTNQLEVYKTKRSSKSNKLLSELIIRNYDMQIYGNV